MHRGVLWWITWTGISLMHGFVWWGGICSPRPQQRNVALSRTGCRALVGDKSPGFGAANSTQLHDLTCLVWLTGNHRLPWLAPFATWGHGAGQAAKIPKGDSHVLHRRLGGECKSKGSSTHWRVSQKHRLSIFCRSNVHLPKQSTYLPSSFIFLKNSVMLNLHQRQTDSNNEKSCYSSPKGRHNSTSEPKCCLTANCLPLNHPTTDQVAQWLPRVLTFVWAQDSFTSPLASRQWVTVLLRVLWQWVDSDHSF